MPETDIFAVTQTRDPTVCSIRKIPHSTWITFYPIKVTLQSITIYFYKIRTTTPLVNSKRHTSLCGNLHIREVHNKLRASVEDNDLKSLYTVDPRLGTAVGHTLGTWLIEVEKTSRPVNLLRKLSKSKKRLDQIWSILCFMVQHTSNDDIFKQKFAFVLYIDMTTVSWKRSGFTYGIYESPRASGQCV